MAKSETVRLIGASQRAYAQQLAAEKPHGWVAKFAAETRRDAQNRKLWPMLKDIQRQVAGFDVYSTDDIKLRFLNLLGTEMRFLPTLEGQGSFPVGLKSSTLTVEQFSGLVELIYKYGAEHDVKWSEPAQGTEARRAETGTGSVHDGPVSEGNAPDNNSLTS